MSRSSLGTGLKGGGGTKGYFWKPEPGRHVGVGGVGHSGKKPELRLVTSTGEAALELGWGKRRAWQLGGSQEWGPECPSSQAPVLRPL